MEQRSSVSPGLIFPGRKNKGSLWKVLSLVFVLGLASCKAQQTVPQEILMAPVPPPVPPAVYSETAPEGVFRLLQSSVPLGDQVLTHQYHFSAPAGYNEKKNQAYPLVVYLHPWEGPLTIRDGEPHVPPEVQALPRSAEHPAFVYAPLCPPPYPQAGGPRFEWNSNEARAMVISTILDLRTRFNIDSRRIYLVGFSMGGSGGWYLGYEYHRVTGSRFAAILRGAGWYLQSHREKDYQAIHSAVALSPTWIHVGEKEGEGFEVGLDNYTYLKNTFGTGPETLLTQKEGQELTGQDGLVAEFRSVPLGTTGKEARLTVYKDRGHENLMFRNSGLLSWLFAQALEE